jgi:predicted nucleic acid-binding protein
VKSKYVTDSMALILRLEKRKMPQRVKAIFEEVENDTTDLLIPAMVLAEIGYLSEKKKIDTNLKEAKTFITKHNTVTVEPITHEIVEETFHIDDILELHDRIIAATAKHWDVQLITNDPMIIASKHINTIW